MISDVTQSLLTKRGVRGPEHAILVNLLSPYNSAEEFYVYGGEGFWFLVFILMTFWSRIGVSRWHSGKEFACQCRRHQFNPWIGKIPWGRKSNSTPTKQSAFVLLSSSIFLFSPSFLEGNGNLLLTWKIPYIRNLVGYSSWDHRVRHD